MENKNIIVLGGDGQLGSAFRFADFGYTVNRDSVSIVNYNDVFERLPEFKPDIIINCAAMTDVDYCEEHREEAEAVNYHGVRNLVNLCKENDIKLVHISTDYVFDNKHDMPISETLLFNPINWYGHTKAKAEEYIISNLSNYLIIRTSWLYGHSRVVNGIAEPARNMVNFFINSACDKAVVDQISRLTNVKTVVDITKKLLEMEETGIFNVADGGSTTPFEVAEYISSNHFQVSNWVEPILSRSLHRKAARPKYSVLSTAKLVNHGIIVKSWMDNLKGYLNEYTAASRV